MADIPQVGHDAVAHARSRCPGPRSQIPCSPDVVLTVISSNGLGSEYPHPVELAAVEHHLLEADVVGGGRHQATRTAEVGMGLLDVAAVLGRRLDELDLAAPRRAGRGRRSAVELLRAADRSACRSFRAARRSAHEGTRRGSAPTSSPPERRRHRLPGPYSHPSPGWKLSGISASVTRACLQPSSPADGWPARLRGRGRGVGPR